RLGDVLGAALIGALEEHVLDEMRDAALRGGFVARTARQPHADRHRSHLRHPFGDETEPVVQDLSYYHALTCRPRPPRTAPVHRAQMFGSEGDIRQFGKNDDSTPPERPSTACRPRARRTRRGPT